MCKDLIFPLKMHNKKKQLGQNMSATPYGSYGAQIRKNTDFQKLDIDF